MSKRLRPSSFAGWVLTTVAFALAGAPAPVAQTPPPDAPAQAQAKRLAALKEQGAKAPLVVLPVLFNGSALKNFGDALGLVLEQQGGFDDVAPASNSFVPPAGTAADAVAPLFGDFVKKSPPGAGHALLAEFVVKEGKFVEVRAWIVDPDGAPVWFDVQHAGDADFDHVKPREPLECCLLIVRRLDALLGVAAPATKREGRMSRLWAEKSGMPSEGDLKAMTERAAALKRAGKAAKIVVFPARVAGELDVAQGASLAKLLGGACVATATDVKPSLEVKTSSNEQRMLWDLARSFQAHLAKSPVDADYALIADYLTSPDKKQVSAVHFVICTGKGEWVVADLLNSHHDDFQAVAPANAADCDKLVLKELERVLR
jgi:hypothetical protein